MEQVNANSDNFQVKSATKIPANWQFKEVFLQNVDSLGMLLGQSGLEQEWQR